MRPLLALAIVGTCLAGCDPGLPKDNVLRVQGVLDDGVEVDFEDAGSRGEWLRCDARFTAQRCVDVDGERFHVVVRLLLPSFTGDFAGRPDCVVDDEPQGVFEVLRANRVSSTIGEDVIAFIEIASDVDGDGVGNGESEVLTTAVVASGTIQHSEVQGFTDPFAFRLTGKTNDDDDVIVEFNGPTSNPLVEPGLEPATTCVADDDD